MAMRRRGPPRSAARTVRTSFGRRAGASRDRPARHLCRSRGRHRVLFPRGWSHPVLRPTRTGGRCMADIGTVIAVTGEDDRFAPVRKAAVDRALSEHATLILYDLDASESPLESPLPTDWSAEGTEDEVGDRLGPEELDAAGRAAIAEQVREARAKGVDAWGWLPNDPDREEL